MWETHYYAVSSMRFAFCRPSQHSEPKRNKRKKKGPYGSRRLAGGECVFFSFSFLSSFIDVNCCERLRSLLPPSFCIVLGSSACRRQDGVPLLKGNINGV